MLLVQLCIFDSGCEACNEWYHGDCINVTSEESQYIKHWYCHICRGELHVYVYLVYTVPCAQRFNETLLRH